MENMGRLSGKKIIVTGGTGFIGSHLVEKLISLDAKILVIDIVCLKESYFYEKQLQKKVSLKLIDIAEREMIAKLFKKFSPDYVLHLAAEAIVDAAYDNPFRTFQTNVMGTVSILEAARSLEGLKGVIVASSDKAYGKTKEIYTEKSPLQGDHPYDVSKSATDLIAQTYYKTYGLPVVVTRFGNVYGEGDLHMNRIIPGILEAIIMNKPLLVRSNGKYVRDYVYVKDVVDGYLFLLTKIKETKGEAFNFSSKDSFSVVELIRFFGKILKKDIPFKILNISKNEIPYQHLNDKKIRSLGWKTTRTIKDTALSLLAWYTGSLTNRK